MMAAAVLVPASGYRGGQDSRCGQCSGSNRQQFSPAIFHFTSLRLFLVKYDIFIFIIIHLSEMSRKKGWEQQKNASCKT